MYCVYCRGGTTSSVLSYTACCRGGTTISPRGLRAVVYCVLSRRDYYLSTWTACCRVLRAVEEGLRVGCVVKIVGEGCCAEIDVGVNQLHTRFDRNRWQL